MQHEGNDAQATIVEGSGQTALDMHNVQRELVASLILWDFLETTGHILFQLAAIVKLLPEHRQCRHTAQTGQVDAAVANHVVWG